MDTPIQDIPKVEAIFTLDDIIKQVEAAGVNLGDDPRKRADTFVEAGLLPPSTDGRYPSWVVQRIIAIQDKLLEGKTVAELQEEVKKERRRFLNQVTDLNSMTNLYKKFSSNSMFMMASFLVLALVAIGLAGAAFAPSNPVVVAGKNTVKAMVDAGGKAAKKAASPIGRTLVTIIKTSKPEGSTSADPLGLTNLEVAAPVIPENLVQLDSLGNLIIKGEVAAISFSGSGENLTNLSWTALSGRPKILSAIDGVSSDEGEIDLVAGTGISISPNLEAESITISSTLVFPTEFIFKNIAVSGQTTIASDLNADTLTFAAGSNVVITTDASTDTLIIGVTGTVSNADTLDLLDSSQFLRSDATDSFTAGTLTFNAGTTLTINGSLNLPATGISGAGTGSGLDADLLDSLNSTAFAILSENENISGNWTFSSTTGTPIVIKPSSGVPGGTKMFDLQNVFGSTVFSATVSGDLTANSLSTGGSVRLDNSGNLANIGTITTSGLATFNDAVTIGDGNTSGDYLTITRAGNANVVITTRNSDRVILQGAYWNGSASTNINMQLLTIVDDTTPSYKLSILNNSSAVVASFYDDGDAQLIGDLTVNGGDIVTGASQLILQAQGANADVLIQGGLCIRDATACPNVATGGLQVDTAGGSVDDPGDVFDVAEVYHATQPVSQGELVSAAGNQSVKRTSTPYDQGIIGVVSYHPAALVDQGAFKVGVNPSEFNPNKPWVALTGRVPTKVSAENGDIEPGDALTSSSAPGVAMKATKSGPIIGKALEAYGGSGVGKIMVFVSTGWYVASVGQDNNLNDLSNINLETLTAGTINTQVLLVGDVEISVATSGALKINGDVEINGNLVASKVTTDELVISKETSGSHIVKAGQKEVTIENDKVDETSKVLVTFISDYSPATRFWVTMKKGESFTVHLDQPVTSDSSFSWLIVN